MRFHHQLMRFHKTGILRRTSLYTRPSLWDSGGHCRCYH